MPTVGPGSNYYAEFTTANPGTGAAQNADSLPLATATRNGTDDATFTLTVTNMATGRYKVAGTVPGGYAAGDQVQVSVTATVATIPGVAIIDAFVITGAAADPWATALPGAYGAGTAGNILGTNLNATVSSRMATFTLPTNFSALNITVGG